MGVIIYYSLTKITRWSKASGKAAEHSPQISCSLFALSCQCYTLWLCMCTGWVCAGVHVCICVGMHTSMCMCTCVCICVVGWGRGIMPRSLMVNHGGDYFLDHFKEEIFVLLAIQKRPNFIGFFRKKHHFIG